jgi:sporulation protein YunB
MPYINVEVERLVNNVVNRAINDVMSNVDVKDVLINDENISYDALKINEIENKVDKKIQQELLNIDDGDVSEYFVPNRIKKGRFKKIKNGILCDVSIGSIRGSTVFSNIGPTIPIKLLFSSQLNSSMNVDISEYGINNAIVKIYINLDIHTQITMPITSKRKCISIKKPVIIDIVRGKIPNYYTGLSN